MDADHDATEEGGRDHKGRFGPGNKFGRGNGDHKRRAALRSAVQAAIEPEDMRKVIAKLAEMSKAGDVQAGALLLAYSVGRPRQESESVELDLGELTKPADVLAAFSRVVAEVAAGQLDVGAARDIGTLLEGARRTLETIDIERRLAALEAERGNP